MISSTDIGQERRERFLLDAGYACPPEGRPWATGAGDDPEDLKDTGDWIDLSQLDTCQHGKPCYCADLHPWTRQPDGTYTWTAPCWHWDEDACEWEECPF